MNLFNNDIKSEHEIKFLHFRKFNGFNPCSREGLTVAYYEKDGSIFSAEARCGKLDNFSKRVGRIKAAARLSSTKVNQSFGMNERQWREWCEAWVGERLGYKRSWWGRMRKGQMEAGVYI